MTMRVYFVADRSYKNFDLLSRAAAVAIETLRSDSSPLRLEFVALANVSLHDLLIQYADSTRPFLSKNDVIVSAEFEKSISPEYDDIELVVQLGDLKYYPYKLFVYGAIDNNITVLEYN